MQKWEESFLQNGFEIIASQLNETNLKGIKKVGLHSSRLEKNNFDNLMQGVDVRKITCREETRKKKDATQKYVAEAAEDVLNIRTTWKVSNSFRTFCEGKHCLVVYMCIPSAFQGSSPL